MDISFVPKDELLNDLRKRDSNSLEFIILMTGALDSTPESLFSLLQDATRVLKTGGKLFVQGLPQILPQIGVFLDSQLTFKYWFAVESDFVKGTGLPSVHAAVMLFTKANGRFNIKQVRLPHKFCKACGRTL